MKKQDKRTDIIAVGTELIASNGYNATGIDTVLKQAGVPKGSFYYYFDSKEDFGLAIIDTFAAEYDEKLRLFLEDEAVSPLKRIRNYMEHSLEHLAEKQCSQGCLIGNLGQELADQNERFRSRLESIFNSWKKHFTACLLEAQDQGELSPDIDPDTVSEFILSGWEGAILRAKVMKSSQPLRTFIDTLFGTVLSAR
jgi:TetR/AcrR family transcriptional repressor of nem operon